MAPVEACLWVELGGDVTIVNQSSLPGPTPNPIPRYTLVLANVLVGHGRPWERDAACHGNIKVDTHPVPSPT